MEKIILSLKNIYKLLMTNDFPIYSESVIGKTERKGLTALGFWQQILIEEFRNGTYGRMIWRNDGKRNRYKSHLCNRSPELKCYMQYTGELAVQINREFLQKQIARFEEFLEEKEYRHEVLIYRVKELMRICKTGDSCLEKKILEHLHKSLEETGFFGKYKEHEKLFHAAYLLSIMSVYAAAGNEMKNAALDVLQTKEYTAESLWIMRNQRVTLTDTEFAVLTAHVSFLEDNALPPWRFFGREEELYDLKEVIATGQKRMITGMGGIGKTELIRQLLVWCREQRVVDRVAVIPCESSLAESMILSFPNQMRELEQSLEQRFENLVNYLKWEAVQGKLLIVIDNYSSEGENEEWLNMLLSVPCSVLVTSRQVNSEKIICYHLQMPAVSTGALIFRDNYEKPLEQQDRDVLMELMEEEKLCHPLTLRLIARAAHNRKWSVTELKEQLEAKGNLLSWKETDSMVRMEQIYRQLYSLLKIPEECREIAELFAMLPRDSYSVEFLCEWFPGIAGGKLNKQLTALTKGGWLDQDCAGYSMHPLIAQCLRSKNITEKEMTPYLRLIWERIIQTKMDVTLYPGVLQRICRILLSMSDWISGTIGPELMLAVLMAAELQGSIRLAERTQQLQYVKKLLENCIQKDENIQICSSMTFCSAQDDELDRIYELYCEQKEVQTVPEWLFLPFCTRGGLFLSKKNQEYAIEMWETVVTGDCPASWKTEACYLLSVLCNQRGDAVSSLKWAEQGKDFAFGQNCTMEWKFVILSELCNLYTLLGKKKLAEHTLDEILKILKEVIQDQTGVCVNEDKVSDYLKADVLHERLPDYITANVLSSSAIYELHYGKPETALENYRELLRIMEMYNEKDQSHYLILGQTAVILQRLQRYEEAMGLYREILEYARGNQDVYLNVLFCNNTAVTLLEMKQPEKALSYLEEAAELAADQGGIPLAEPLRNLARAYREMGDAAQEFKYLKKAAPILEECYGTEHPRTKEAAERFDELKKIF